MESLVFFISEKTAAKRTAYRNSHRTIFRKRHGYQNKIHLKKSKQFGKTREKYSGNLKDKKITIFSGKSRAVSWWKQTICTKNKSNTDFGMAIAYINKCLS